ncbi:MAG: phosphoribosylanthranilate isomerase [Acidimicrobiales bacterium]|nr:phosphoribosylanthranilate isomerase [Acidimicrobiales bacterium]
MFIKICGITTVEDALLATALGADALGFVFASSHRQVSERVVRDIVGQLPADVMTVGVFRNMGKARVVETVNRIGLRAAQLHGNESPTTTRWVAARVPVTIRALSAGSSDVERFEEFGADLLLLDAPKPGSGEVFDWSMAAEPSAVRPVLLAGGLSPDNVREAIERVDPYGVDVSTGVEAEFGKKDPRLLRAFMSNARSARPHRRASHEQDSGHRPFDWERDDSL